MPYHVVKVGNFWRIRTPKGLLKAKYASKEVAQRVVRYLYARGKK